MGHKVVHVFLGGAADAVSRALDVLAAASHLLGDSLAALGGHAGVGIAHGLLQGVGVLQHGAVHQAPRHVYWYK